METLSLPELKRLTRPFLNKEDEAEAFRYWQQCTSEEKIAASTKLTREFWLSRGVDPDAPQPRTLRIRTLGDPEPEHEEIDRAYEVWRREK